ncbi:acetyltransferase [Salinisphaera sp. T31B1]|uniref:acetyltransferase n=1 Tax=Salinisphaera sp. T31B1 TaxID=727963 RepID=UPI003342C015
MNDETPRQLAERVREACLSALLAGHEQAAIAGLCGEGAFEAAVGAVQELNLDALLADPIVSHEPPSTASED